MEKDNYFHDDPYLPQGIEILISIIEIDPYDPDFKRIWIEVIEYLFSYENVYKQKSIGSKIKDAEYWLDLTLFYSDKNYIFNSYLNPETRNTNIMSIFDDYIRRFGDLSWHH